MWSTFWISFGYFVIVGIQPKSSHF